MLLFNYFRYTIIPFNINFNTSNVTIQPKWHWLSVIPFSHFNTSNVTIQQLYRSSFLFHSQISIHLMLLFNKSTLWIYSLSVVISIHLMLLFNQQGFCCQLQAYYFNTSNVTIQPYQRKRTHLQSIISIHLMLLFNGKTAINKVLCHLFQYI